MTITILPTRNEYTAAAAQSVFNYTFKIFTDTDLNVYQTPAGQVADDSADLITAYTVAGVGAEDGGSITLTTPASAGDLITIVSDIPDNRTTDYQNNGDFLPDVVNDDFDRVVSLVKQIQDVANRTVVLQESQQGPKPLTLPGPENNKLLRWKQDLSGLENIIATEVGLLADADDLAYQHPGTNSVLTNVGERLDQHVVVSGFLTTKDAALAAEGLEFAIPGGETVTLLVPTDFATPQDAINAIKLWTIPDNSAVIISIEAGEYIFNDGNLTMIKDGGSPTAVPVSTSIKVSSPNFKGVKFTGPTETNFSTVSLISITDNGASDHDVVLEFTGGVASAILGRYLKVRATTGTGDHANIRGCWEITNVNAGSDQLTIKVKDKRAAFNATTLTGGVYSQLNVTLEWENLPSPGDDFGGFDITGPVGEIDKVAIIGDGSTGSTNGVVCRIGTVLNFGQDVGIAGWGRNGLFLIEGCFVEGVDLQVSDCVSNGINVLGNSYFSGTRAGASGCGTGFVAGTGGTLSCSTGSACGNATGMLGAGGGNIVAGANFVWGNTGTGVIASEGSVVDFSAGAFVEQNTTGIEARTSSKVLVTTTTAQNNGTDYLPSLNVLDTTGAIITDKSSADTVLYKLEGDLEIVEATPTISLIDGATTAKVDGDTGALSLTTHSTSRDIKFKTSTTDIGQIDGTTGSGAFFNKIFPGAVVINTALPFIYSASGTPEGAVTAPVGSLFMRTDGGANTTLYVKESGVGNTGWVAK